MEKVTELEAAIERLEAEKQRRIDERIERGEVVRISLPLVVTGLPPTEAWHKHRHEEAIAALRAEGEKREIVLDPEIGPDGGVQVSLVCTGVPRADDDPEALAAWEASPNPNDVPLAYHDQPLATSVEKTSSPKEPISEPLAAPAPTRRIWIQTKAATGDDPGSIAEAQFRVSGNAVHLEGLDGKPIGSQPLSPGQDAATIARQLLRRKTMPDSFWGPLPEKRWWQ